MTKHTKGPWRANVDDMGGVGEGAYVTIDTGPLTTTIIRVMAYKPRSLDPLPYKENALLAAAAPELKEALEAVLEVADYFVAPFGRVDDPIRAGHVKKIKKARSALAKAEGKRP